MLDAVGPITYVYSGESGQKPYIHLPGNALVHASQERRKILITMPYTNQRHHLSLGSVSARIAREIA